MENEIVEQQRQSIAAFLEIEPFNVKFDWNCLHQCHNKLCSINVAKMPVDLELIERTDEIEKNIIGGTLAECFELVVSAADWYESLFKKPKTRKNAQQNQDI